MTAPDEPTEYASPIDLMHRTGDSFARDIAQAFICANTHNQQRLLSAFPELFDKYEQLFDHWKDMKS